MSHEFTKFKPEVKELLLKKLKSGRFKKGKHRLLDIQQRDDGKFDRFYCCLGVACHAAPKEVGYLDYELYFKDKVPTPGYAYDRNNIMLTKGMQAWTGLSDPTGLFIHSPDAKKILKFIRSLGAPTEGVLSLATLNDNTETFDEVIQVIERFF